MCNTIMTSDPVVQPVTKDCKIFTKRISKSLQSICKAQSKKCDHSFQVHVNAVTYFALWFMGMLQRFGNPQYVSYLS